MKHNRHCKALAGFFSDRALPLVIGFGLVWTAFFALLIFRAFEISSTDERLCNVIRQIVVEGDQALASVSYYRDHPDELRRAHARNARVLELLTCDDLPSGGG